MSSSAKSPFPRPVISRPVAKLIAKKFFGIKTKSEDSVSELDSYEDRNFLITTDDHTFESDGPHRSYVLKIFNAMETYVLPGVVEATDATMLHVKEHLHGCVASPVPLHTVNGNFGAFVMIGTDSGSLQEASMKMINNHVDAIDKNAMVFTVDSQDSAKFLQHYIRLLPFLPGERISSSNASDKLLFNVGKLAANLSKCLENFNNPAFERKKSLWDMKNLMQLREPAYLDSVVDASLRESIERFYNRYEEVALEILPRLPKQIIHSDISRGNILVKKNSDDYELSGLIDFGDVSFSYRVLEISNCMADIGMLRENNINDCGLILAGFLSKTTLSIEEWAVLFLFVLGRQVQCIIIGYYRSREFGEENDYVADINSTALSCFHEFLPYLGKENEVLNIWKSCKESIKN